MAVDVGARVSRYEVTSAPVRGVGRGRLRLVWVRPPDVVLVDEPAATVTAAGPVTGGLAVLDAYRITRVPEHRAAS